MRPRLCSSGEGITVKAVIHHLILYRLPSSLHTLSTSSPLKLHACLLGKTILKNVMKCVPKAASPCRSQISSYITVGYEELNLGM